LSNDTISRAVILTDDEMGQARLGTEERIERLMGYSPSLDDQILVAYSAYQKLGGYFSLEQMRKFAKVQ